MAIHRHTQLSDDFLGGTERSIENPLPDFRVDTNVLGSESTTKVTNYLTGKAILTLDGKFADKRKQSSIRTATGLLPLSKTDREYLGNHFLSSVNEAYLWTKSFILGGMYISPNPQVRGYRREVIRETVGDLTWNQKDINSSLNLGLGNETETGIANRPVFYNPIKGKHEHISPPLHIEIESKMKLFWWGPDEDIDIYLLKDEKYQNIAHIVRNEYLKLAPLGALVSGSLEDHETLEAFLKPLYYLPIVPTVKLSSGVNVAIRRNEDDRDKEKLFDANDEYSIYRAKRKYLNLGQIIGRPKIRGTIWDQDDVFRFTTNVRCKFWKWQRWLINPYYLSYLWTRKIMGEESSFIGGRFRINSLSVPYEIDIRGENGRGAKIKIRDYLMYTDPLFIITQYRPEGYHFFTFSELPRDKKKQRKIAKEIEGIDPALYSKIDGADYSLVNDREIIITSREKFFRISDVPEDISSKEIALEKIRNYDSKLYQKTKNAEYILENNEVVILKPAEFFEFQKLFEDKEAQAKVLRYFKEYKPGEYNKIKGAMYRLDEGTGHIIAEKKGKSGDWIEIGRFVLENNVCYFKSKRKNVLDDIFTPKNHRGIVIGDSEDEENIRIGGKVELGRFKIEGNECHFKPHKKKGIYIGNARYEGKEQRIYTQEKVLVGKIIIDDGKCYLKKEKIKSFKRLPEWFSKDDILLGEVIIEDGAQKIYSPENEIARIILKRKFDENREGAVSEKTTTLKLSNGGTKTVISKVIDTDKVVQDYSVNIYLGEDYKKDGIYLLNMIFPLSGLQKELRLGLENLEHFSPDKLPTLLADATDMAATGENPNDSGNLLGKAINEDFVPPYILFAVKEIFGKEIVPPKRIIDQYLMWDSERKNTIAVVGGQKTLPEIFLEVKNKD